MTEQDNPTPDAPKKGSIDIQKKESLAPESASEFDAANGTEAPSNETTASEKPELAPEYVPQVEVTFVFQTAEKIRNEMAKVLIGQDATVEYMLTSLFIGGHCLLEGFPGIAKTLASKSLAKAISADFKRIQFTPDLMPTDVTGTSIFNLKEGEFNFKNGPIFSNIILIDEINRAPAKTQAALMEVMEEKQLTYDGTTYEMDPPFFVVATQNPIEQEGTYSLPEAQLDRFIFRIIVNYPEIEDERKILSQFQNDFERNKKEIVQPVASKADILKCMHIVEKVYLKPQLLDYIANIVVDTRKNADLFLGASPRASLAILKASKALAAIRGRDFVTPEDIQSVAHPVLNHRIIISHEREMDGSTNSQIIDEILKKIEVPR